MFATVKILTRDDMNEVCCQNETDNIEDDVIYDILMGGCTGYQNFEDGDVIDCYGNIFDAEYICKDIQMDGTIVFIFDEE